MESTVAFGFQKLMVLSKKKKYLSGGFRLYTELLLLRKDSIYNISNENTYKRWCCLSGGFRPHLELLGHAGHVHVPTVVSISHISDPKFLDASAWLCVEKLKNMFFLLIKTLKFNQKTKRYLRNKR